MVCHSSVQFLQPKTVTSIPDHMDKLCGSRVLDRNSSTKFSVVNRGRKPATQDIPLTHYRPCTLHAIHKAIVFPKKMTSNISRMSAHKQLCFIQYASMNLKSEWHVIILKKASSSSKTHPFKGASGSTRITLKWLLNWCMRVCVCDKNRKTVVMTAKGHPAADSYWITFIHARYSPYFTTGWEMPWNCPLGFVPT